MTERPTGEARLRVTILGSGSPPPSLSRSAPSVVVEHNGRPYLFDVGDGTTTQLLRGQFALRDVTTVLFTHLHADHSLGYGQLLLGGWIAGRRSLRVYGPERTAHLHDTLLHDLYRDDVAYRVDMGRTPDGLLDKVTVTDLSGAGVVLSEDGLTITRLPVLHSIPTFAYRLQLDAGPSLVISGDTAYYEPLAEFAAGADLLIQDSTLTPMPPGSLSPAADPAFRAKLAEAHTSAEQAGRLAALARARALILTHLMPDADTDGAIAASRTRFTGFVVAAADLLQIEIPSLQTRSRQPAEGGPGGPLGKK